ncbi:MAG: 5-formyltetrahydrofolate cyclo-ligase [Akkermansiaceae bacterium]
MMSSAATNKAELRSEIRSYLASISKQYIETSSASITRHLANAEQLIDSTNTIAIYAAIQNEISLSALHQLLPDKMLLYPRCKPGYQLSFHHVTDENQLVMDSMQIPEPLPDLHPEFGMDSIDVILCPGLAFGTDGSRLGRGHGYYDRALDQFSGIKVGIALNHQIAATVPHSSHDAAMDYLVSESGISATRPLQE